MGYDTRYTGEIRIEPPLTWAEVKTGPGLQDLRLRTVEDVEETDEGRITRITVDAVIPLTDEKYKGYDIVRELQALVDAHKSHQFTGYISAEGEVAGDLWRLAVKDRVAMEIKPRVVWPDEPGGEA